MFVEGKGFCAPRPHVVSFTPYERHCIERETKYKATVKNYGYDNMLIGDLGEHALGKLLESNIGATRMSKAGNIYRGGDGGVDIAINGYTIQVKTRQWYRDISVIRNPLEYRNIDAFVFCSANTSLFQVNVLGYIVRSRLFDFMVRIGSVVEGDGLRQIPAEWLSPISELISVLAEES